MKNLGGISIDFVEKEKGIQCAIGIKLEGVPEKTLAVALTGLLHDLCKEIPGLIQELIESSLPENLEQLNG